VTLTFWLLPSLLLLLPPLEAVELAKASVMSIELEKIRSFTAIKGEGNALKMIRNMNLQHFQR
jgi:hypothetical protein